jgi:hypothetical protein
LQGLSQENLDFKAFTVQCGTFNNENIKSESLSIKMSENLGISSRI